MDCATLIQSSPLAPSMVSKPWSTIMLTAWSWGGSMGAPVASWEYHVQSGQRDRPTASSPRK